MPATHHQDEQVQVRPGEVGCPCPPSLGARRLDVLLSAAQPQHAVPPWQPVAAVQPQLYNIGTTTDKYHNSFGG